MKYYSAYRIYGYQNMYPNSWKFKDVLLDGVEFYPETIQTRRRKQRAKDEADVLAGMDERRSWHLPLNKTREFEGWLRYLDAKETNPKNCAALTEILRQFLLDYGLDIPKNVNFYYIDYDY